MATRDFVSEIKIGDLLHLRDLYLKDWPENVLGYYTLHNYIKWLEKDPNIEILKFYCLNDDVSDGTFAIKYGNQLFTNTINNNDNLKKLLLLIDWSSKILISTIRIKHRSIADAIIEKRGLNIEIDDETLLFYMSANDSTKITLNLPEGMILHDMSEDDVVFANSVWEHSDPVSYLKRAANLNENVGLYQKDGTLVAWCFRLGGGRLGALQVKDQYRRKGYGEFVCRSITRKIGEKGEDVFACVLKQNLPSIKMFEKIGFKIIDRTYWIHTMPTIPSFQ